MKEDNSFELRELTRYIQDAEKNDRIRMKNEFLDEEDCGCIGALIAYKLTGEDEGYEIGLKLLLELLGVSAVTFRCILDEFTDFDRAADNFFGTKPWTGVSYGHIMNQISEAYESGKIDQLINQQSCRTFKKV